MCRTLLELPDLNGNSFGWIQFSKSRNTAALTKKIPSLVLGLSHADKQQDRRTDVSVLMGAFLQQFFVITTQQLKPVIIGTLHFVVTPGFTPASIMIPSVALPKLLHDID